VDTTVGRKQRRARHVRANNRVDQRNDALAWESANWKRHL
jgi:hypothetical protein